MESILIQAASVIIMALVGCSLALLKKRTNSEVAKQALDSVDQIVTTVVGSVAQTVAKEMRKDSANGKLTKNQQAELRMAALSQAKGLLRKEVSKAAETQVGNLSRYMQNKIEERVGESKR